MQTEQIQSNLSPLPGLYFLKYFVGDKKITLQVEINSNEFHLFCLKDFHRTPPCLSFKHFFFNFRTFIFNYLFL